MSKKDNDKRCKALTMAGKPCRAWAMKGSRLCFLHGNPGKAPQLGQLGGLKNRHVPPDAVDPLPTADTAVGVLQNSTQIINDLYKGKLEPKVALALKAIMELQLGAIKIVELEWYAQRAREKRATEKSAEAQLEASVRGNGNQVAPPVDSAHLPEAAEKEETEGDPASEDPSDSVCEEG
jgi:hypothetical protein